METVVFFPVSLFYDRAVTLYAQHRDGILTMLPKADVQHVGSTAIAQGLTKGDLDLQVRVPAQDFQTALQKLGGVYAPNEESIRTDSFASFKDEHEDMAVGVQLCVEGSQYDIFWKIRDVMIKHPSLREQYDALKRRFDGHPMAAYRQAKEEFFDRLMQSAEYRAMGRSPA